VAGERAASLVEYCLVIALIAMMCIAAIGFFGSNQSGSLTNNANSIATAG
jgi:Flp pilus assembly pilin Flp